jgi:hypothetical protein
VARGGILPCSCCAVVGPSYSVSQQHRAVTIIVHGVAMKTAQLFCLEILALHVTGNPTASVRVYPFRVLPANTRPSAESYTVQTGTMHGQPYKVSSEALLLLEQTRADHLVDDQTDAARSCVVGSDSEDDGGCYVYAE